MKKPYIGTGKIITAYKGDKSDDWFTPKWLYEQIKEEFNIDYDPCPYKDGEKLGLFNIWGKRVFVNPPYSNIENWLNKAMLELQNNSEIIIFLVFARTGTAWFHKYIWDGVHNNFNKNVSEVRFIRGRLKFGNNKTSAPDDSMLVIFRRGTK